MFLRAVVAARLADPRVLLTLALILILAAAAVTLAATAHAGVAWGCAAAGARPGSVSWG